MIATQRQTGYADVAFVVRDEWQGRGIGTALFQRLTRLAVAQGIVGFTADVLLNNSHMLAIFEASGFAIQSRLEAGVRHLEIRFVARVAPDSSTVIRLNATSDLIPEGRDCPRRL